MSLRGARLTSLCQKMSCMGKKVLNYFNLVICLSYSCTVFSMGTNFEVKLSVAEDADGVSWLGLGLDMKEDELKPSWYRACG